jgi:hypothetical protein
MVTTTPTRPRAAAADPTGGSALERRSSRPDGVFATPEVLAAISTGRARPRRTFRLRSRAARVLHTLRLPPPMVEVSGTPTRRSHESAAAIGVRMRRRNDPNP